MKNPTTHRIQQALRGAGLGSAVALGLAVSPVAAGGNPFAMTPLAAGYMLGAAGDKAGEGKCGEGKCGEGKNGEGKCGCKQAEMVCGIYQVGSGHKDDAKVEDGKCGGHKCPEGACGGAG